MDKGLAFKKGVVIIGLELLVQVILAIFSYEYSFYIALPLNMAIGGLVAVTVLFIWDIIHDTQIQKLSKRVSALEEQQQKINSKIQF